MTKPQALSQSRLQLRIRPDEKATIVRAAKLEQMRLADFVLRSVMPVAQSTIERSERLQLTERDSQRVLELLEHPPAPNSRLLAAAQALPFKP